MVFIKPPAAANDLLGAIYHKYRHLSDGSYRPFYLRRWHSHVRIFGGTFFVEDIEKVMRVIKEIKFYDAKLCFSAREITINNSYVFVQPTQDQSTVFNTCNKLFAKKLDPYRSGYVRAKYRKDLINFDSKTRELINSSGRPYPYNAHITLGSFKDPFAFLKELTPNEKESLQTTAFETSVFFVETSNLDYNGKKVLGPFPIKA